MSLAVVGYGLTTPVPFADGLAALDLHHRHLVAGGPSTVALCQSQPVLTAGDKGPGNAADAVATPRAGGPTWFGPGILLVAPIVRADPVLVYNALLTAAAGLLLQLGLPVSTRPHYQGLWAGGPENGWRKVASIGLWHDGLIVAGGGGIAINLHAPADAFAGFDACNLPGVAMTSLAAETGTRVDVAEAGEQLAPLLLEQLEPVVIAPQVFDAVAQLAGAGAAR